GIFSRICQRSALQPSPGTPLRRRTSSRGRGVVQSVCQSGGFCLSTGSTNHRPVAQHQRQALTRLNSLLPPHVQAMSRKLDYPAAEDPELVKGAQKGDMEAFEELDGGDRAKTCASACSEACHEGDATDHDCESGV